MTFFKRTFIAAALSISMLVPLVSFAATDNSALIAQLMAQIKALSAQLQQLRQQQSDGQWCHTFNQNLGIGTRGDEEQALETALSREGFPVEHSSNFESAFNEQIASAVTGFQEKYKDEILTPNGLKYGTGYVGKSTRAKLNQLYGCNNNVSPAPYPTAPPVSTAPTSSNTIQRDSRRIADVKQLQLALELYSDTRGTYPASLYDLAPTYIVKVPQDPLGNMYNYLALPYGCSISGIICNNYHIGTNLETANNVALGSDFDYDSSNHSGGIRGADSGRCSSIGSNITGYCYDSMATRPLSVSPTVPQVKPSITLLLPNGGESFTERGTLNVKWSSTNGGNEVGIMICIPNSAGKRCSEAASFPNTGSAVVSMAGALAWSSGQYVVRIVDLSTANWSTYDESNAPFNIIAQTSVSRALNITSPNGGERVLVNTPYDIRWISSNVSTSVNVQVKNVADGRIVFATIVAPYNGIYRWTPTADMISSAAKVYIEAHDGTVSDTSDSSFSVVSTASSQALPDLVVSDLRVDMRGASNVIVGNTVTISATVSNNGSIAASNINFITDLGYQAVIADESLPTNRCLNGMSLAPGAQCVLWNPVRYSSPVASNNVRVTADLGNTISELSETNNASSISFSIIASQPSITVLAPNGGERWELGKTYSIQWSSKNFPAGDTSRLVISTRKEGESSGYSITGLHNEINDGVAQWTIPYNFVLGQYKIIITSVYGGGIDESDLPFSIVVATTN